MLESKKQIMVSTYLSQVTAITKKIRPNDITENYCKIMKIKSNGFFRCAFDLTNSSCHEIRQLKRVHCRRCRISNKLSFFI